MPLLLRRKLFTRAVVKPAESKPAKPSVVNVPGIPEVNIPVIPGEHINVIGFQYIVPAEASYLRIGRRLDVVEVYDSRGRLRIKFGNLLG